MCGKGYGYIVFLYDILYVPSRLSQFKLFLNSHFSLSRQNLVMVAGGAIFALYEVSTALSVREQRRLEAAGWGPVTKIAAKVSSILSPKDKNSFFYPIFI